MWGYNFKGEQLQLNVVYLVEVYKGKGVFVVGDDSIKRLQYLVESD